MKIQTACALLESQSILLLVYLAVLRIDDRLRVLSQHKLASMLAPSLLPLQVLFAAASYASLEAVIMESYLRGIGNLSRPLIGGMLYLYHVFVMLPTVIMVSYLLAHLHCRDSPFPDIPDNATVHRPGGFALSHNPERRDTRHGLDLPAGRLRETAWRQHTDLVFRFNHRRIPRAGCGKEIFRLGKRRLLSSLPVGSPEAQPEKLDLEKVKPLP